MSSFGEKGQGPGEIQGRFKLRINERDEILISNSVRDKLIVLDTMGDLVKEISIALNHFIATSLKNGKILAMKAVRIPGKGVKFPIVICDADLENTKTLSQGQNVQNYMIAKELNGLNLTIDTSPWSVSKGLIYIGSQDSRYEFLIYDSDGVLIKKIRKAYRPVKVPRQVKQKVYEMFDSPGYKQCNVNDKVYFPDNMPPFQYFFTDDAGRLYVMTREKGEGTKDFLYDIFNPEGIFIGRISLDNSGNEEAAVWGGPFQVMAKNNLLYCMRVKESGFKELVTYKMTWE